MQRFSRQGFSLIESAIVLGIVGLVLGGIWSAAAYVGTRQKISSMAQNVVFIGQNIRQLYNGQSMMGVTIDDLIQMSVIPADMVQGTMAVTPWGRSISIYEAGNGGVIFEVRVNDTAECLKMHEAFSLARYTGGSLYDDYSEGFGGMGIGYGVDMTTAVDYCTNQLGYSSNRIGMSFINK